MIYLRSHEADNIRILLIGTSVSQSDFHHILHHLLLLMAYGLPEAVKYNESSNYTLMSVDLQL